MQSPLWRCLLFGTLSRFFTSWARWLERTWWSVFGISPTQHRGVLCRSSTSLKARVLWNPYWTRLSRARLSRADPGQRTSRQLAEMAASLVSWRNGEELFHPASALQCLLGAPPGAALPAPALPYFIPATAPSPLCHQAGPSPGSLLHQPQGRADPLLWEATPQAGSRLFGVPGEVQGELGGDDNCCEMSHLLIAKNHSPYLCSCPTPGTREAEIPALWGPCPSSSCPFSALYHARVELMVLSFPPLKPFPAAREAGESKKRFVWGKRLKEETLLQNWVGSNSLRVSG